MNKKIICRLLICLMLITMLPVQVHAIDRIDLSRSVTLTVNFTHEGQPLPGADIKLYKVGEISDRGEVCMTETFAAYPFQLNELEGTDWAGIANTMAAYAQQDQLDPVDRAVTDSEGRVYFPRMRKPMEPGLYLVTGDTLTYNKMCYTPVPTLVALPNRQPDSHHWDYDVTIDMKYTMKSAPADYTVTKVWEDSQFRDARPESVKVNLLCDGKVVDTVELSSANNWSYTWPGLEVDHNWTVTEDVPDFYNVSITQDQTSFTVKNILDVDEYMEEFGDKNDGIEEGDEDASGSEDPKDEDKEKLPQTGSLWWPVFAMMIAGLGCLIAGILRMRALKDET